MENANAEDKFSRKRHARRNVLNLVHLSIAFVLIFTAYRALENLQSSLNFEGGLGTSALSIIYATNLFSGLFIGAPIVYRLGPKWSMFLCFFGHTLFIVANVRPHWLTLGGASLVLGVLSAPLWIAQGAYVTFCAAEYGADARVSKEESLKRMHGIFYVITGLNGIVGNLMSSLIFKPSSSLPNDCDFTNKTIITNISGNVQTIKDHAEDLTLYNHSIYNKSDCDTDLAQDISVCGAHHCPQFKRHLEVLNVPDPHLVRVLLAAFLLLNLCGIVLCALLRDVKSPRMRDMCEQLSSVARLMGNTDLLLMIMAFFHMALSGATFYSSFLQSFVSCPYGIHMVGYTMVAQASAYVLVTTLLGRVRIPRQVCVGVALGLELAMGSLWLLVDPKADTYWIVIVYALTHGAVQASYKLQFGTMTSLLFEKDVEAAFAHYNIWGGLGACAGFALTSHLCFVTKDIIYLSSAVLLALSYTVLEIKVWKRARLTQNVELNGLEKEGNTIKQEMLKEVTETLLSEKTGQN